MKTRSAGSINSSAIHYPDVVGYHVICRYSNVTSIFERPSSLNRQPPCRVFLSLKPCGINLCHQASCGLASEYLERRVLPGGISQNYTLASYQPLRMGLRRTISLLAKLLVSVFSFRRRIRITRNGTQFLFFFSFARAVRLDV